MSLLHFEIELPLFPTHIQISKNKWIKVSGNRLWSGLKPFFRSTIKKQLSAYCNPFISQLNDDVLTGHQIGTGIDVHIPRNYGSVRRSAKTGEILHYKAEENYVPNWDLKNFTFFWSKTLDDCLVECGKIPDDNVSVLSEDLGSKVIFVDNLDMRKLVYKIKILNVR